MTQNICDGFRFSFQDNMSQLKVINKKEKENLQKNQYQIKGLPNIGNTCFLNSIFQQLFALQKFRQAIIDRGNRDRMVIITLLGKIFLLMKQRDQQSEIRRMIRNFIKQLENDLFDYRFGQQNDSFDTLMTILNCIFDEDFELSNMFDVQYASKCKCYQQQAIFQQYFFTLQQPICQSCSQQFKTTLKNQPQYLIIKHKKDNKYIDTRLSIDNPAKEYQFISTNIYKGDGSYGHYYSVCKYKDKYIKFDDNTIRYVNDPTTTNNHLFSVYASKSEQTINKGKLNEYSSITQFNQKSSSFEQTQCSQVIRTNLHQNNQQKPLQFIQNVLKNDLFDKMQKKQIGSKQTLQKIEEKQIIKIPNKPHQDNQIISDMHNNWKQQIIFVPFVLCIIYSYHRHNSFFLHTILDILNRYFGIFIFFKQILDIQINITASLKNNESKISAKKEQK